MIRTDFLKDFLTDFLCRFFSLKRLICEIMVWKGFISLSIYILGEATLKEIQAALHDIAQAQLDMQRLEGNNSEFTFKN